MHLIFGDLIYPEDAIKANTVQTCPRQLGLKWMSTVNIVNSHVFQYIESAY